MAFENVLHILLVHLAGHLADGPLERLTDYLIPAFDSNSSASSNPDGSRCVDRSNAC